MNLSRTRKTLLLALPLTAWVWGSQLSADDEANTASESATAENVVLASNVEWTPPNPLRGEKGPKAATLWPIAMAWTRQGFS